MKKLYKMKKLVLLFSVTLITFSTIAQEENLFKEGLEEVIVNAKAGEAEAQYNLGTCYENGDGVKKDLNRAKYWYDKALKNNSSF